MLKFAKMTIGAASVMAAGCARDGVSAQAPEGKGASAARNEIAVNADVTVTNGADGNYAFEYKAPYADAEGNFDFSVREIGDSAVNLTFTIAEGSADGIKFMPEGADAIWIVEKAKVDNGSPTERYVGEQFHDFVVSGDGRQLSLTDDNNDGVLYRYALRFDLNGETVVHDPDTQNGPPH